MRMRPSQEKKQPESVIAILNKLLELNQQSGKRGTVQPSMGRELALKLHELRQALAALPDTDKLKIKEHFAKTEYTDLIEELVSDKKVISGSLQIAGNINEEFRDMLLKVLPESKPVEEFDPAILSQFSTFRVVGTQRGGLSEQALSSIQSAQLDREYLADLESSAEEITPIELLVKSLQALYAVKKSGSRLGREGQMLTHAKLLRDSYAELDVGKQQEFRHSLRGHAVEEAILKLIENNDPKAQLATVRDVSKKLKEDDGFMQELATLRGMQRKFSK